MIPYLLVTAIVNIALGYALAVYLGRESATLRETATTPLMPMADSAPRFERWSEDPSSPTAEPPTAEKADSRAISAPEEMSMAAPNELAQTGADGVDGVDDELLAGIEDFRYQLAQLRRQAGNGVVLDPLAIGASR